MRRASVRPMIGTLARWSSELYAVRYILLLASIGLYALAALLTFKGPPSAGALAVLVCIPIAGYLLAMLCICLLFHPEVGKLRFDERDSAQPRPKKGAMRRLSVGLLALWVVVSAIGPPILYRWTQG